jgi:hypothetical protein
MRYEYDDRKLLHEIMVVAMVVIRSSSFSDNSFVSRVFQ